MCRLCTPGLSSSKTFFILLSRADCTAEWIIFPEFNPFAKINKKEKGSAVKLWSTKTLTDDHNKPTDNIIFFTADRKRNFNDNHEADEPDWPGDDGTHRPSDHAGIPPRLMGQYRDEGACLSRFYSRA